MGPLKQEQVGVTLGQDFHCRGILLDERGDAFVKGGL
jgi:hypothetical protein